MKNLCAHKNGWSEIQHELRSPHTHANTPAVGIGLYRKTTCRNFGVVVCMLFVVAACNARKLGEIQLIRRNNWRWRQPCPVQYTSMHSGMCARVYTMQHCDEHEFFPISFFFSFKLSFIVCDIWILVRPQLIFAIRKNSQSKSNKKYVKVEKSVQRLCASVHCDERAVNCRRQN